MADELSNVTKRTAAATEARRLPEGMTLTKPYRFTLSEREAAELEGLSKGDRDAAMVSGLRSIKRRKK